MVGVAQLVEPRIVIPVVVGSSPIIHPIFWLVTIETVSVLLRKLNHCVVYAPTRSSSHFNRITSISAEERPIPDDCEILEGWVTVWIDQVRQAREEIINLKMEGQEPDSELSRKFEYVTYESERFSEAFEKRCNSQGAMQR